MSDVIWAAMIAVAGSGITGSVAYRGAIASARESTKRELARLRDEHREADRRVRRDAYVRLMNSLEELDLLVSSYTPVATSEAFDSWLRSFRAAGVATQVLESPDVQAVRRRFGELLNKLAQEMEQRLERGEPMDDALGIPYFEMRTELNEVGKALSAAIRDDLDFAKDASSA